MKSLARLKEHPWIPIVVCSLVTLFSVGCKSSRSSSDATANPLGAYTSTQTTETSGAIAGSGETVVPGSTSGPVISVPTDGSSSIAGHDNAPMLTNSHAGWQQSSCLACHSATTNNPDHNYADDSLCYLCHGTNGLPGFSDTTPPVLSSVVVSPAENSVTISWKSDKDCVSRMILKTIEGDKMEFPVSTSYTTAHKYTVTGLQSATTYYYELISVDKSGNKTSTSSFSSVLMFQTNAHVEVKIDDPSPDPGPTPTPSDSYFSGVTIENKGNGQFRIVFKTREKPDYIYWYLTNTKDPKDKYSDNIDPRDSNEYDEVCDSYKPAGTYTIKLKALKGSADPIWSKEYKITLKD